MVPVNGFGEPYRCDRDRETTGKKSGGGVCCYVNENWCPRKGVTIKKSVSTHDADILCLSLRPRYLPREFGQVFVTVTYIPCWASKARALLDIAEAVRELQLQSPDAPNFILHEFTSIFAVWTHVFSMSFILPYSIEKTSSSKDITLYQPVCYLYPSV